MANELTLLRQTSIPERITVADGTGIPKGTLLQLTDPNTGQAKAATAVSVPCAGVAAAEKIASNGETSVAVHKTGDFKATLSGACLIGDPLMFATGATNKVSKAKVLASGAHTLGTALEAGANSETIRIKLSIGVGAGVA